MYIENAVHFRKTHIFRGQNRPKTKMWTQKIPLPSFGQQGDWRITGRSPSQCHAIGLVLSRCYALFGMRVHPQSAASCAQGRRNYLRGALMAACGALEITTAMETPFIFIKNGLFP